MADSGDNLNATSPGTWALFSLRTQNGAVHPDDRAQVPKVWDAEKEQYARDVPLVFQVKAVEPPYATLEHGELRFRCQSTALKPLAVAPIFRPGATVKVRKSGEPGVIRLIDWHFKKTAFLYLLTKGSHRSTEWFFDEDLVAATPSTT